MLASRLAAAALAAGALIAVAAPASFANTEVNPNPAKPGATVTVDDGLGSLFCPSKDKSATATSNGFAGGSITLTRGTMALVGSGKAVTTPGTYNVSITCAGGLSTGPNSYSFTVSPAGGAATGDGASLLGGTGGMTEGAALAVAGVGLGALALRRRKADSRA